ncbi:MAG: twin-arginine translocase TatA/TatE family subunit [Pseudolysinimonas sp.]
MFGNLTGWHFLIVLAIILLLFGATKLPALAKSVGQSMKVFRNEIRSDDKQGEATSQATDPTAHVDEASSDKK